MDPHEIGSRRALAATKPGRHVYTATIQEFSYVRSRDVSGETVLLTVVKDSKGRLMTDHVWMGVNQLFCERVGKFYFDSGFPNCDEDEICLGNRVEFTARVSRYTKAYGLVDYGFSSVELRKILPPAGCDEVLNAYASFDDDNKTDGYSLDTWRTEQAERPRSAAE